MKSNSNIKPTAILYLGDGTWHYNYNVVENETEYGVMYNYDTILCNEYPSLEFLKKYKESEIEAYYNSDEINLINIGGIDIYLDPSLRQKITERIESAKLLQSDKVNLTINGVVFSLEVMQAEMMMAQIINQYGLAYDVKEAKINEVKALQTIEEVESYEVKSGYPEKLVL